MDPLQEQPIGQICHLCAMEGQWYPTCHSWSVYRSCSQRGHTTTHCLAQWKEISRRAHSQGPNFGNGINQKHASASKSPFYLPLPNSIPTSTPWHSLSRSELQLATLPSLQIFPWDRASQVPSSTPQGSSPTRWSEVFQSIAGIHGTTGHQAPSCTPAAPSSWSNGFPKGQSSSLCTTLFQPLELQHWEFMSQIVVQNPQAMHEGFTIVTINPLLVQPLHFGPLQEVIHGFLEDHMRL
jgi:hypothetical protein